MRSLILFFLMLTATMAEARNVNEVLWTAQRLSGSAASSAIMLEDVSRYDITATVLETQPANDTAISGVAELETVTFPAKAAATDGDRIIFTDGAGLTWGLALDKDGVPAGAPSGAIWVAIPAARKTNCDISGTTDAASVAAAAELCFDALTGISAAILTDDSAADGTMTFTCVEAGPVTNGVPKNSAESGAGSITVAETTPGVAGKVSVVDNTINFGAPGYITGLKGRFTTTSALPTGLATSTDYWLIKVDGSGDLMKVAASMALAVAGTAIDITAIGVGTHTFVVDTDLEGDIKLQKNDAPINVDPIWVDVGSSTQAVDAAGTFNWTGVDAGFRQLRAYYVGDSSEATVYMYFNGK